MIFLFSYEHRYSLSPGIGFDNSVTVLLSSGTLITKKWLNFQILDWLSHSPTDIESYIRPGCIVLTVYLRQDEDAWEEVSCYLSLS